MTFLSRQGKKEKGGNFLRMLRGERAGPYPKESPRKSKRKTPEPEKSTNVRQITEDLSTLASGNLPEGFARLRQPTTEAGTSRASEHGETGSSHVYEEGVKTETSSRKRRREDDDGILIIY
jgi:hypothetical protein